MRCMFCNLLPSDQTFNITPTWSVVVIQFCLRLAMAALNFDPAVNDALEAHSQPATVAENVNGEDVQICYRPDLQTCHVYCPGYQFK